MVKVWKYRPGRDVQQDAPLCACEVCGGEVYRYDEVADMDGHLVHADCLTAEDLEIYATAPAVSFYDEVC